MIRKASFKSLRVPQGSIFGPILFNLCINNLFFFIEDAELANFPDDNSVYVGSKDLTELLEILRKEWKTEINWFKTNKMIANPNKFRSMIISSIKDLSKSNVLNINGVELNMESSAKLLGIEIYNKLYFEKYISYICKKASNQLNVIYRLQKFMRHKKKEEIINISCIQILITAVLFGTSVLKSPKIKWKKFMKGV